MDVELVNDDVAGVDVADLDDVEMFDDDRRRAGVFVRVGAHEWHELDTAGELVAVHRTTRRR